MVWGKNMADTLHHVHSRAVQAIEKGTRLIVIDPRQTDLAARADLWLRLRPGSDLALALAMINVIVKEELYDKEFVDKYTLGFDQLSAHIEDYPPERVEEITWVPADKIRDAARLYAESKPAAIQWGNGIDQGVNSFQTARAIAILSTPRTPVRMKACGRRSAAMALVRVRTSASCPITSAKFRGRYLRARTW